MSRARIMERRARARRKRYLVYALVGGLLVLALSAVVVYRNGDEGLQTPSDDFGKSKGDPDAPVVVEEYGDFQ